MDHNSQGLAAGRDENADNILQAPLLRGNDLPQHSACDWSGVAPCLPIALARPQSAAEAATFLESCSRHQQPVVLQGGMTGLAGGATPQSGDLAVSTSHLRGIGHIDTNAGTMVLSAGTTLAEAQSAADAEGWLFPLDLGARDSAQIGGSIANNAGGLRVLRHGPIRANLLGVEAALPNGRILSDLRGLMKDNTGYDLSGLFCGSEGTLGLVTRAVFKLHPRPAGRLTALCGLPDYAAVLKLLAIARNQLPRLSAFEIMWGDHYRFNAEAEGLRLLQEPLEFAVILETETDLSASEQSGFEDLLSQAFEAGILTDAMLPQSQADLADIWTVREGLAMDNLLPGLVNLDISAPAPVLGAVAGKLRDALNESFADITVLIYGHLADGNLHITASVPQPDANFAEQVDSIVYPMVATAGGSISAEHGIGSLKRDWLHLMRSPDEIALMKGIKSVFDPAGIMNRGKLFT